MKSCLKFAVRAMLFGVASLTISASAQSLRLSSAAAVIEDASTMTSVFSKNSNESMPIASMTKLMTAMVVLDANLPLEEEIEITSADVDYLKNSSSRVPVGARFKRGELLHLALMSSDNRAAHALARAYPGGVNTFVWHMNEKVRTLHLRGSKFTDPTGLHSTNVATPSDVALIANAAYQYSVIREYSSDDEEVFEIYGRPTLFRNTNGLVRGKKWPIELSKTGFIQEAGRCIVMRTTVNDKPYYVVLMDSVSSSAREADAKRVRAWLSGETYVEPKVTGRIKSKALKSKKTKSVKAVRTGLTKKSLSNRKASNTGKSVKTKKKKVRRGS